MKVHLRSIQQRRRVRDLSSGRWGIRERLLDGEKEDRKIRESVLYV